MNNIVRRRAPFAHTYSRIALSVGAVLAVSAPLSANASVNLEPAPQALVDTKVTSKTPSATASGSDAKAVKRAPNAVTLIYQANQQDLLWSVYGAPRERAYEALEALQRAPEHGLNPERYATEKLYALIQNAQSTKELREFDHLLTAAIWSYNEDLRIGAAHEKNKSRHNRGHVKRPANRDIVAPVVEPKAVKALAAAIANGELREHLEGLPPVFEEYLELQKVLDTYNDYHLLGGWEALPADMRLKPGDSHPAVDSLRYRLILTDGLSADSTSSGIYDKDLQAAILRFQNRHGLAADGEIGPATLRALNETSADKIHRIGLNLARLRQLPRELPRDRVKVNIPEFKLRMYRDEEEALSMGVVVGSRRTPTPAMQDKIRHLVFNPYWYPPRNITVREILPRLRRDPGYLERTGFELLRGKTVVDASLVNWKETKARNFPYRLRQTPGEKNSLGSVKFIFPNKQAIYLHDTPSRKLFGERVRAFSHGCVRVEKPTELATALMDWDRGWTKDDVIADISAAKRKLRKFKERMAIYLLYQTATIENGVVSFHQDIYGNDRRHEGEPVLAPLVAAAFPSSKFDSEPAGQQLAAR